MDHPTTAIDLTKHNLRAPLVSVVVTNFNYGRFLRECLESIAAQTYPRFECIIVDDASTDDSMDVIEGFLAEREGEPRFRVIQHPENLGQAGGFRSGLEESTGQFVCYVDADDILFEDFLKVHVDTHLTCSSCAAFSCSEELVFDRDRVVVSGAFGHNRDSDEFLGANRKGDDLVVGHDSTFSLVRQPAAPVYLGPHTRDTTFWPWTTTSAMMFRRTVLERVIPEDLDMFRICADYYICLFSHFVGGSILIPNVLGGYRRHGGNGFSSNPVLGGGRPPGPDFRHPSFEVARDMIRRAILRDEESWREILGTRGFAKALKVFPSLTGPEDSGQKDRKKDASEVKRRAGVQALRRTFAWLAPNRFKRYQVKTILQSGLFFEAYYASQLENRATAVGDLAEHYVRQGAAEGLDPNPFFDSEFYRSKHPTVVAEDWNPLFHYLIVGSKETARTSPHFDPNFYLKTNPTSKPSDPDSLTRFLLWGADNGLRPLPFFTSESEHRLKLVRTRRTQDQEWRKRRDETKPKRSDRSTGGSDGSWLARWRRQGSRLTARVRRSVGKLGKPDFFIIGAQKCGTSSLVNWLHQQTPVHVAYDPNLPYTPPSEFKFFSTDEKYARGVDWYRSHFPPSRVCCEKTVEYFFMPKARERMHQHFPDAKLVVMLREPVARAYSAFRHYQRAMPASTNWGWNDPAASFTDNIRAELDQGEEWGLVGRGMYANQLESLFQLFPRTQVHIIIFERLRADPRAGYARLCEFLDIPFQEGGWDIHANRGGKAEPVCPEAHRLLTDFMAPHNQRLFDLLGDEVPEWEQEVERTGSSPSAEKPGCSPE